MRRPLFLASVALAAMAAEPITTPAIPPAGGGASGAGASASGGAAPTTPAVRPQATFINAKVSTRQVALNQPVRVEFFTGARQIENIDIPAAISAGVAMSSGKLWRLVGKPVVSEGEKIRTVQVAFTVVARQSGELPLPRFPLTWLSGDPLPEFGAVKVDATVLIAGETRPLPKEADGVGGYAWGARLADLQAKDPAFKALPVEARGDISVVKPRKDLELLFRQGELAEAALSVPDLGLEQAQVSFFYRWGVPAATGEHGALTWVLGWTRITASAVGEGGVRVQLAREDIVGRAAAGQVKGRVFDVLEGGR